jgi:hypothetical protein
MAGVGDVFRGRAEFHRERGFGDHCSGERADDVNAEHFVGFGVGDYLHKAIGVAVGFGAAVRHEGEFADLDLAALLGLFLGQANVSDFGHGVDDAGDHCVVHDAGLTRDKLRRRNALILGLVRQHRPGGDVANGIDARDARLEIMADFNLSAFVESDARLVEAETFSVRTPANADEHAVSLNGFDRRSSGACRRARCGFDG